MNEITWKARGKKWERDPTGDPSSLVKNGFLTPEDRLYRNVGK